MGLESLQASLSVDVEPFVFGFGLDTCAVWLLASEHIVPVSCIMYILSIAIVPALA
jgi:hypothetical protein